MKKPAKLPDTGTGIPLPNTQEPKEEPNPFKATDWRLFLFAWSGFTLRVLLCVGAVFSAVQFLQSRQDKRVERTLEDLWGRFRAPNIDRIDEHTKQGTNTGIVAHLRQVSVEVGDDAEPVAAGELAQ